MITSPAPVAPIDPTTEELEAIGRVLATRVLDATWRGEGFPVDPVGIGHRLGVEVYSSTLDEHVSGALRKQSGRAAELYCRAGDRPNRQRVVLAHLLAHYLRSTGPDDGALSFVERDSDATRCSADHRLADEFAHALLLPDDFVRMYWERGWRELEIAFGFEVPLEVAQRRLRSLGLSDA